jgi:hypothetical protein
MNSSVRQIKTAITPPSASGTALQTADTLVAPTDRRTVEDKIRRWIE